jgi:hypothetical protein
MPQGKVLSANLARLLFALIARNACVCVAITHLCCVKYNERTNHHMR